MDCTDSNQVDMTGDINEVLKKWENEFYKFLNPQTNICQITFNMIFYENVMIEKELFDNNMNTI